MLKSESDFSQCFERLTERREEAEVDFKEGEEEYKDHVPAMRKIVSTHANRTSRMMKTYVRKDATV